MTHLRYRFALLAVAALAASGCAAIGPYREGRYDDQGRYHGAGYEAEHSGGYRKGTVAGVQPTYPDDTPAVPGIGRLADSTAVSVKLDGGGDSATDWPYDPGLAADDPVEIRDGYAYPVDPAAASSAALP
jgi:hypothetical protein